MAYLASWYWDKGNFRKKNEDSFSLQRVRLRGFLGKKAEAALAVVCDGIGGLPEGETASGFVAEQLTEWFYREGILLMSSPLWRKKTAEGVTDALGRIQEQIERCERAEEICCGTTCTVALVKGKRFVLLHVGDSRAFLMGRRARRLTQDHVKNGALCRCVGAFGFQFPDVLEGNIHKGGMLLLCTDGFYRFAQKGLFKGRLFCRKWDENQLHKVLMEAGEAARAQGEQDNQTAVLLLRTGR